MSVSKAQCQPQPLFQDNWAYVDPIPAVYLMDPACVQYQCLLDHIKTLYQHRQSEYFFIKTSIEPNGFGFLINSIQADFDTLKLGLNGMQTSYNNLLKAYAQTNIPDFVLQSNNLKNSVSSFVKNNGLLLPKMIKEHDLAMQVLFQVQDWAAIQEVLAPGIEYGKSKMEFTANALQELMSSGTGGDGTANSCIDLTGSDIGDDRDALRNIIKDLLSKQQINNRLENIPK